MPVRLDQPDRTPLAASPLTLVVFQVRFETNLEVSDALTARQFHDLIGGRQGDYPVVEPVSNVAVQLATLGGADPAVTQRQTAGWRFRSEDASWIVSMMPDNVALETSRYEHWEDFRTRLDDVLAATHEHLKPVFEQRLGLRYVNQLALPEVRQAADWEPWINRDLLGPLAHERLREGVVFARQQLALDLGDGVSCSLAHGSFPTDSPEAELAYLLDYDVSRQTGQPFDPGEIRSGVEAFNTAALALFQLSVTPAYLEGAGHQ